MKKVTALLLATLMLVTLFSGCQNSGSDSSAASAASGESSDSNPYAEKVTFTVYSLDDSDDFMSWPLVEEAKEKFNFDFKIQQIRLIAQTVFN